MESLLTKFQQDGFLVLKDFNTPEECDALMQRAELLSRNYNLEGHKPPTNPHPPIIIF